MAIGSGFASTAWRNYLPQFSLRTLLAWMAIVAVTVIGLASASKVGAQLALSVVILLAAISLLEMLYGDPAARARIGGRLIFGGMFFLWTVAHVDRLVPNNGYALPAFGAVTGTLNELAYDGIILTRRVAQPPTVASAATSASPYPVSSYPIYASPAVTTSGPYSPAVSFPQPLPTTAAWTVVPATVQLPYYEFHTIANCFWTLVLAACGGWIATLIQRRKRPHCD